jgi:nitrite reductase/ring-hydroxylating ferredoxin subunit
MVELGAMPAPGTAAIDYKALVQDDRIHASLYTDPRIFEDEMDRIFARGWVFVGHASEVPRPGDWVTRTLGREPVVMVRGRDGAIHVLVNRCMHRGTMLCQGDRGTTSRSLTCPYHGWSYDLDGTLLGVPYPGGYAGFDKSAYGLRHAARVDSYRGFVFACLDAAAPTLAEHLGHATKLIDRSCDLSPQGEVELTAGWVRHRCAANWKALPENDSDGYHLGFVHMALFRTVQMQYQRVVGDEKAIKAVIRDWGRGHIEIDWSPGYTGLFEWFGGASGPLVERFVAALERRDGPEVARRRVVEGPAHALIFPNLFLGETNIAIVEPVSPEVCVHWHTPMFLKGVPEFNGRLLRMAEAGMGPASFLMPEDLIIAARNQRGLHARGAEWLLLSRGLNRETVDADGRTVSHVTDESTNRGLWQHYRTVMSQA